MPIHLYRIWPFAWLCLTHCMVHADESKKVSMTGYFVIEDGQKELKAGSKNYLAIVFQNLSKEKIYIDAANIKGKEQMLEEPRPKMGKGILPCYLAKLHISFFNKNNEVVKSENITLTASAVIYPNEEMLSLVTVNLPNTPGLYNVKVNELTPARDGSFATKSALDELSNLEHLMKVNTFELHLDNIEINENEK